MTRGTTPTLTFKIGLKPSKLQTLYITGAQSGRVVFERTLDQMVVNESASSVAFKLTQEETLGLSEKVPVYLQGRGLTTDGNAVATDILQTGVSAILKEGVI